MDYYYTNWGKCFSPVPLPPAYDASLRCSVQLISPSAFTKLSAEQPRFNLDTAVTAAISQVRYSYAAYPKALS